MCIVQIPDEIFLLIAVEISIMHQFHFLSTCHQPKSTPRQLGATPLHMATRFNPTNVICIFIKKKVEISFHSNLLH